MESALEEVSLDDGPSTYSLGPSAVQLTSFSLPIEPAAAEEPLDAFSNAGTLDDEDECLPSTQQGQQVAELAPVNSLPAHNETASGQKAFEQFRTPASWPVARTSVGEWDFADAVWEAVANSDIAETQWWWPGQGQLTLQPHGVLATSWSADEGRWTMDSPTQVIALEFSGRQYEMTLSKGSRLLATARGGPAAFVRSTQDQRTTSQLELVFHPKQGRIHCQEWHKWLLGRHFTWGDEAVVVFRDFGRLECPWESNALWLPAPDCLWNPEAGLPEYRVLRSGVMHRVVFAHDRRSCTVTSDNSTVVCSYLPLPEMDGQQPEVVLARARTPGAEPTAATGYLMKRSGLLVHNWKPRWCVLASDGRQLEYFEPFFPWWGSEQQLVNAIPLATATLQRHEYNGRRYCFHLEAPRTLKAHTRRMDHFFCAKGAAEANAWFDLLQMAIERANVAWCSEAPVPRAPRSMWEVFEDALQGKSAEPIAVDPDFNQTRSCSRRKCLPWM